VDADSLAVVVPAGLADSVGYAGSAAVTLDDVVLSTGDGAGLTAQRAVSLTANEAAGLLLLDLGGSFLSRC
jgi:Quercetinase C-terminal cupin domain